jgi:kumamolisin
MKLRPYVHKPRTAPTTTYSPAQIAAAYSFPQNLPAGGVIAIIELGGGYVASDIAAFCEKFGIAVPTLVDVPCDAENSPGTDADMEVALDIEIAAGVYSYCTGEAASIRVYWATDIIPAVERIVADKKAGVPIAAVSISWGAPEDQWTAPQDCKSEDAAIAMLAPLGIPFFAAAGDNDSGDGEQKGNHVDFPASSPHVIGCGGTSKPSGGPETVWNDGPGEGTGGGFSSVFPAQPWQVGAPAKATDLSINGRMVPDVAANADPATGYEVYCASQGGWQVVGGTSAVSPLYAGLFAAINPAPVLLEQNAAFAGAGLTVIWANQSAFIDISQGGNGAYQAAVGPDPCTGVGVPKSDMLAKLFSASPLPTQPPANPPLPEPPAPPVEPPAPEPPEHHHHKHHKHHPVHGGHGHDHHGDHSPVWWHCQGHHTHGIGRESRFILAADEREAHRKFLASFGAVASEHQTHATPLPDYRPTEDDLALERRLSAGASA